VFFVFMRECCVVRKPADSSFSRFTYVPAWSEEIGMSLFRQELIFFTVLLLCWVTVPHREFRRGDGCGRSVLTQPFQVGYGHLGTSVYKKESRTQCRPLRFVHSIPQQSQFVRCISWCCGCIQIRAAA